MRILLLWFLVIPGSLVLAVFGVEALRWFTVDLTGLYDQLSLTDGCLVVLIVLQTATLVRLLTLPVQPSAEVRQPRVRSRNDSDSVPSLNSRNSPYETTRGRSRGQSSGGSPAANGRMQPPARTRREASAKRPPR